MPPAGEVDLLRYSPGDPKHGYGMVFKTVGECTTFMNAGDETWKQAKHFAEQLAPVRYGPKTTIAWSCDPVPAKADDSL